MHPAFLGALYLVDFLWYLLLWISRNESTQFFLPPSLFLSSFCIWITNCPRAVGWTVCFFLHWSIIYILSHPKSSHVCVCFRSRLFSVLVAFSPILTSMPHCLNSYNFTLPPSQLWSFSSGGSWLFWPFAHLYKYINLLLCS